MPATLSAAIPNILRKEHARRCLEYLERTHSVTLQRTHHYTIVSVVNWAAYQHSEDEAQHADRHTEHHAGLESATRQTPHRTPRAATPSKEEKNLSKKYKSNSAELDSAPEGAPVLAVEDVDILQMDTKHKQRTWSGW